MFILYLEKIIIVYVFTQSFYYSRKSQKVNFYLFLIRSFLSPRLVVVPKLKNAVCPIICPLLWVIWIYPFSKGISKEQNTNSHVQDFYSNLRSNFLPR